MTERPFITLAAVLLFMSSCDPRPDTPEELEGHWVSTLSSEFLGLTIQLQGDSVRGEAELMPQGARLAYPLVGTTAGEALNATIRTVDGQTISVRGELRGDTLYARLTGGRFDDRLVPLVKSPP